MSCAAKTINSLIDTPVQARLHLPADQQFSRPESGLVRTLYDCPDLPVGVQGDRGRLVVATHPTTKIKSRIGVERGGARLRTVLDSLAAASFHSG
jgi:hypothetical protein